MGDGLVVGGAGDGEGFIPIVLDGQGDAGDFVVDALVDGEASDGANKVPGFVEDSADFEVVEILGGEPRGREGLGGFHFVVIPSTTSELLVLSKRFSLMVLLSTFLVLPSS